MTDFAHSRGDSCLSVQTPEGIEFVLYPAGLVVRACAWAVDSLIQGAALFVVLITAGVFRQVLGIWLSLILMFALDWFYHTVFEVFFKGQSPGKRLVGIRVIRADGSPVNPGASFLRNLLRFADTFMFLYLVAFICMLVSPGFRRFGDWAADTLVIYTDPARSSGRFNAPALQKSVMPWLADVPLVTPSRKLGYDEKQAVLSFARRYSLLGKARADEIAGVWAETLVDGTALSSIAHNESVAESGNAGADFSIPEVQYSPSGLLLGIAHTVGGTL